MTHPLEKYNKQQAEFLANCPPQDRRMHELLFIIGNATYRYHQIAKDFKPTIKDWEEWLEGLPENVQRVHRKEGFEACRTVWSFSRYVNEKSNLGLNEFLKQNIPASDLEEYYSLLDKKQVEEPLNEVADKVDNLLDSIEKTSKKDTWKPPSLKK